MAIAAAATTALALAACAPKAARTVPPAPRTTVEPATPAPSARATYELDAEASVLRVLVHRDGPLARFGHNHVLHAHQMTGAAWLGSGDSLSGAGFELHVPVAAFAVDDAADRAAIGGDFAGVVPDDARTGTYRNLVRPEVLDAAAYPSIDVRSLGEAGPTTTGLWHTALTVRGLTVERDLKVTIDRVEGSVIASGELSILQSELGIKPFGIVGGAVAVADAILIRFELRFVPKRMT